jgi:hypothetical protein
MSFCLYHIKIVKALYEIAAKAEREEREERVEPAKNPPRALGGLLSGSDRSAICTGRDLRAIRLRRGFGLFGHQLLELALHVRPMASRLPNSPTA